MTEFTIIKPDDWHLHLRDGAEMASVLPDTTRRFERAIVMPNLRPPVTTTQRAQEYRQRILQAVPAGSSFNPLMTLYLTDNTAPDEIVKAKQSGIVHGVKLYPAGATTNSDSGVTDIRKCAKALEAMQSVDMPLLVHGEVTDAEIDVFDREKVFIERIMQPMLRDFPNLRVVFEHITTQDAAEFVAAASANVAATITPHHLLMNRNAMFTGGIRPHHYCLPVLKRETHRRALVKAATSGSAKFFLGTDSAPHAKSAKESDCGCAGMYNAANATCIDTSNLGPAQLASFSYFTRLPLADNPTCPYVLTHNASTASAFSALHDKKLKLLWEDRRAADRDERLRLYEVIPE